jgi:hypothetical protein
MEPLKQTRFLAANYSSLQGLRSVPVGLLLLFICIWANGQHGPARDLTLPILFGVATLALLIVIDRYYLHVFGRVQRTSADRRLELIGSIFFGLLALGAFMLDTNYDFSVSSVGLVFAVLFLVSYLRVILLYKNRSYTIDLVMSILILLVSSLPLLGLANFWSLLGIKHALLGALIMVGVIMVTGGIGAHIYFVRSLPRTLEAIHE